MTTTTEPRRRYIVIHQESGSIVGSFYGKHDTMQRMCERFDRTRPGTYVYDDASEAVNYRPTRGVGA